MPALKPPILLCLPGLGGGPYFFEPLHPLLAGVCRMVAIDPFPLPSGQAFAFDPAADLVVDLARKERAAAPDARVCLLGHSMGTILALEAIRRSPAADFFSALIVVGGLPEPLPESRTRIRTRADAIRQHGIVGTRIAAEVVAANFSIRSQRERTRVTDWFVDRFERQDPTTYADTAWTLAAWQARVLPPLDGLSCLAITGEEDRYAPPDAVRAFARALPPDTRVEIMPGCGHLPFLEDPPAFAALVTAFLGAGQDVPIARS
jgi:pimeloyl-ACP methyl ester carboxylesterase